MSNSTTTINQLSETTTTKTKTMEVPTMTITEQTTKMEIRNLIETLHPMLKISNTAFKVIKRAQLIELHECLPEVIRLSEEENLEAIFEFYIDMAKRGNVFPMADVSFVEVGASEASTTVDASEASNTVKAVETTPVVTELTGLPRAGIKDGVLGLYVNKELTEGIVDLSYAQKQIDDMFAELVLLKTRVMELEGKQSGVVEQAPDVTKTEPIRTGHQPRYSREELEAMRANVIAGNTTVTASREQALPAVVNGSANGAYTKEKIEAMRSKAQQTNQVCQCGHHVTKANLAFVMRPKVQALIASEYKGVALCWHCQQSVLVGGKPFTVEERKAGIHKNVVKANVNLK